MFTFTIGQVVLLFIAWQVLSAAANAMSMTDRSFYGFCYRFMRLLTVSAIPAIAQELHLPFPSPVGMTTLSNSDSTGTSK